VGGDKIPQGMNLFAARLYPRAAFFFTYRHLVNVIKLLYRKSMKSSFDLAGKVCVVVGGGLIGAEFARRVAQHGARVVIADIDEKKGAQLAKVIKATFIACDATNEKSVADLAAQVQKKFGKVDAVVNAAYPRTKEWGTDFEKLSYEDFLTHIGLQTGPQFLTARAFGTIMKKQKSGSIVFVGSIYGTFPPRFEIYKGTTAKPTPVEYAIAKGGLWALTRYLAKYYAPFGVRVNMISPGGVEDQQDKTFKKKYTAHALLDKRMAMPEDLSSTLVHLFSEASKYITGQNIIIDGGWTL
jgi:NAD(P)-dependent dehydrogenase (short-subunit alcohol dehydrogenase family)